MNPDRELAYCSECKHLFSLIDMAEQAKKRGLQYPDRPDSFVITCETCKTLERIFNPDLYFRTVAAIKHEMDDNKPAG